MRLINFKNTLISRDYCTPFLRPAVRSPHSENILPRQQNFRAMAGVHWQAQLEEGRGVQYVHCVMHKCIMVKKEGKRKTRKVCKKST